VGVELTEAEMDRRKRVRGFSETGERKELLRSRCHEKGGLNKRCGTLAKTILIHGKEPKFLVNWGRLQTEKKKFGGGKRGEGEGDLLASVVGGGGVGGASFSFGRGQATLKRTN